MHASGVHATVAGVLLGFAVPVRPRRPAASGGEPGAAIDHGADRDLAERFEHIWRPVSAGVAVPVFAFFAAGVDVGGWSQFVDSLTDRLTVAVMVALVVGKTIGVWLAARLVATFTQATLAPQLSWWDVFGVAMLAGMGFTVSLLIGELAFGTGTPEDDAVKIGVIVGSVVAALLAAVVAPGAQHRLSQDLAEEESRRLRSWMAHRTSTSRNSARLTRTNPSRDPTTAAGGFLPRGGIRRPMARCRDYRLTISSARRPSRRSW